MGCACSQGKPIITIKEVPKHIYSTFNNINPIIINQNSHTEPTNDTFTSPFQDLLQKNSLNKAITPNIKDPKRTTTQNVELQPTIEEAQELQVDKHHHNNNNNIRKSPPMKTNKNYFDFFSNQPLQIQLSYNSQPKSKQCHSNRGSVTLNYLSISNSSRSCDKTPSFSNKSNEKNL
jgi:hypothetical protein